MISSGVVKASAKNGSFNSVLVSPFTKKSLLSRISIVSPGRPITLFIKNLDGSFGYLNTKTSPLSGSLNWYVSSSIIIYSQSSKVGSIDAPRTKKGWATKVLIGIMMIADMIIKPRKSLQNEFCGIEYTKSNGFLHENQEL